MSFGHSKTYPQHNSFLGGIYLDVKGLKMDLNYEAYKLYNIGSGYFDFHPEVVGDDPDFIYRCFFNPGSPRISGT